jgi:hypothetical protein
MYLVSIYEKQKSKKPVEIVLRRGEEEGKQWGGVNPTIL